MIVSSRNTAPDSRTPDRNADMSQTTGPQTDTRANDHEHAVRRIEEFWGSRASGAAAKILTGATLAFADLGYHGASTREIASRAPAKLPHEPA